MKTQVRHGIWTFVSFVHVYQGCWVLTISDNLARAGNNVAGASLCRSIASSTKIKRHLASLFGY